MITATVLRRSKPRFDMAGRRLPDTLHDTDMAISAGTVARLHRFALRRLTDAGFDVSAWSCEVYTMDAERPPADRTYTVEFTNPRGGMIGVQGILMERGWPVLDHGLCVDEGRR